MVLVAGLVVLSKGGVIARPLIYTMF